MERCARVELPAGSAAGRVRVAQVAGALMKLAGTLFVAFGRIRMRHGGARARVPEIATAPVAADGAALERRAVSAFPMGLDRAEAGACRAHPCRTRPPKE